MSFYGFMSAPVSIPPTFDTTPCLEHLMEYEDCVIDVGTDKKQFFMPSWPTLYPALHKGKVNMMLDTRPHDVTWKENFEPDGLSDRTALTDR